MKSLVQLNQNTTDTIISTVDKSIGNEILRKLWYNASLEWEFGVAPVITILNKIDNMIPLKTTWDLIIKSTITQFLI